VLERLAYLDALRRVSIVSTERTKGVRVEVLQDKLLVTTTNPDLGEAKEEVAADVTGLPEDAEEAFDIGYNARYLIEVLSALSTDEIVLETNDRTSPTIVRDRGEEDSFYVVMPMRF